MVPARRVSAARPRARGERLVLAALFAPLLLLLLVAVRTWRAEQRYATVTQQVVRDYASIAAWQYARRADAALHDEAMRAFGGVDKGRQRMSASDTLASPEAMLATGTGSRSALLEHARFVFRYDAGTRRLTTAGGEIDDRTRAMLQRRLTDVASSARTDGEPHAVLFDSTDTGLAVALWTVSTPDRPARAVYGVVAPSRALDERFAMLLEEPGLLPGTTARVGRHDITIRLSRRDGGLVFASAGTVGATAGADSTGLQRGELRTTVDFSPDLADALLVGGAPGSQLPSLALIILVAAVLAGVGLVQERRSRELDRLRGRFVANVSHELRTPLAQISLFAETLALGRERSAAEGRQFASIIHGEARRLTALVESVLRFSRAQAGQGTLRLEPASVASELDEAVSAFAPIARSADATVSLHVAGNAWAALDRAAFRQVILNLLDNAVRHGGRGVAVDITVARANGEVRVAVDDTGPGVPAEWRERVFEPFVRMERAAAGGAGIGLAVVRDIVAAHGGRAWIDAAPRSGSRFVVTLPAVDAPVHPATLPAPEAGATRAPS